MFNKPHLKTMSFLMAAAALGSVASAQAAPAIFNFTEIAAPGEAISIQGDLFGSSPSVRVSRRNEDGTLTAGPALSLLTKSNQCVTVEIPSSLTYGLYLLKVFDASNVGSNEIKVNIARGTSTEFDEVGPGDVFRIFGRNMKIGSVTPAVRFVSQTTGTSTFGSVDTTNSNSTTLRVAAPTTLVVGQRYDVFVRNGFGGGYGETKVEDSVLCRSADGTNPFSIPTPWGRDFRYADDTVYDVKAYGATGNGTTNDLTAVRNAIAAADANPSGGTVYFPAGNYRIDTADDYALNVPSGVVFRGQLDSSGNRQSTLTYPTTGAWGVALGATSGVLNLNLYGRGIRMGNSKIFQKNVYASIPSTHVNESVYINGKNIFIDSSSWDHRTAQKSSIAVSQGASYYTIRNSALTYWQGRIACNNTTHSIWENNRFTRDGDHQNDNSTIEDGGLDFSGSSDIVIQNNRFDLIGAPLTSSNYGETLLSQMNDTKDNNVEVNDAGTITSVVDADTYNVDVKRSTGLYTAKQLRSLGMVMALVEGQGAGQWRRIASNTSSQINIEGTWAVQPTAGTKFSIVRWGRNVSPGETTQAILRDNTLVDMNRGILFFAGCNDVWVGGNNLTNSDGIGIKSDDRDYNWRRFSPSWNAYVTTNTVTSTNGLRPAHISAFLTTLQTDIHGISHINTAFRNNTVDAYLNSSGNNGAIYRNNRFGDADGYWCFVSSPDSNKTEVPIQEFPGRDNTTQAILGSVWTGNKANDVRYILYDRINIVRYPRGAWSLSTGVYQTTIRNSTLTNCLNAAIHETGAGTTHADVGTVGP